MTAFVANNGAVNYFDAYTGGSVNATLDTYTISANSTLTVRTDSYSCPNHTVAFGSLDTVSFTGQGGTLNFDPTYVRVIAYTGGSGNSPAYGTTITANNGTTGVFLGAWTTWQVDPIVAGAAIGATGFIKLGGVSTPGNFNAGALTGITATCSGADVQGWIEVRGETTATITVPRIGKVTSTEAWFELGTTNGTRGQIIPCPTTATAAGTFPGVWIETAAGSGVYERFFGAGSQVALSTTRTTAEMKIFWSTTTGIRLGNDGTNGVGYLPPTGCKVRIPAIILTNCTRSVTGSGARVLPNATIATRQEFVTTSAGYLDFRGVVSQWYMNFSQAFYVKYKSCAINDALILSEIASPLDVDDCIVSPTQAQLNTALQITSCFAGGTIKDSSIWRFSLASSGSYSALINYVTGVTFNNITIGSLTLRANATTGCITSTQAVSCTFTNCVLIGGRGLFLGPQKCTFNTPVYYDHTITTTTTSTNGMSVLELTTGGSGNKIDGVSLPIAANGPYTALVTINACYSTKVFNFGTYASKITLNSSVTGIGINSAGNNDGIECKRVYLTNTRTGPWAFVNSDTNVTLEHVYGDYADTTVLPALNAIAKNCGLTGATTGQTSVYGTHFETRFLTTTSGFVELFCNEPTSASATQCFVSGGTPQFSSTGNLLLTKALDQVTWEMPFFCLGFTAFTNTAPTVTGTNVTFTSGSTWGNHTIEYQINTGAGYSAWKAFNNTNLITETISATAGFKLKFRATTLTANAGNILTNIRVAMTTTDSAQGTSLYPLSTVPITISAIDINGTGIQNVQVLLTTNTAATLPFNTTVTIVNSGTTATVTHTGHGLSSGEKVLIKSASLWQNNGVFSITVTDANTYTYTMTAAPGSSPTGTIKATYVFIYDVTDVNGLVSVAKYVAANQPVTGWARKSSGSPYYKTGSLFGTVTAAAGAELSTVLISDE